MIVQSFTPGGFAWGGRAPLRAAGAEPGHGSPDLVTLAQPAVEVRDGAPLALTGRTAGLNAAAPAAGLSASVLAATIDHTLLKPD
ncbi:MAG: hypothetical protein AB1758_36370, partial [Candidatus Eremiobacterota bacterium]